MLNKIASFLLIALFILTASTVVEAQDQPQQKRVVPRMLKDGRVAAYVSFTRPLYTQALQMNNPDGVTYEEDVQLGSRGVKPGADSKKPSLYFQVATDQLITTTGTFYVSVQYLDAGKSALELEYYQREDEEAEPVLQSQRIFLGNSGFWERHTFQLEDAFFDHLFENESDFKLHCPDILIRQVAVTRVPFSQPKHKQFDDFRQPTVSVPPGYSFAIHINANEAKEIESDVSFLQSKMKLYRSWGVQSLIETFDVTELYQDDPPGEKNPVMQRAELIQQQGINWVPRFSIGNVNQIPTKAIGQMQRAVSVNNKSTGPMISLWEPALPRLYTDMFIQLKRKSGGVNINQLMLSFAGDWGPLLLSTEQSGGYPDFWIGDPLAQRSLARHLSSQYGTLSRIASAWGRRLGSWDEAVLIASTDPNAAAKADMLVWYQQSLTRLMANIVQSAKNYFPQAKIAIEVGDRYLYTATDYSTVAALASQSGSSLVMTSREETPTRLYTWLMMARSARILGVPFGLHLTGQYSSTSVMSGMYSMASEGGRILQFHEAALQPKDAWDLYSKSTNALRSTLPNRNAVVVFPRTAVSHTDDQEFSRIVSDLRERFDFDVVDELELQYINPSQYPIVIVPVGHVWRSETFQQFERLARGGSALIVHMDQAWQSPQGDRTINEQLFAGKLEQRNGVWTIVPRSKDAQLTEGEPIQPADRRNIQIGTGMDQPFLEGKWSAPEGESTANFYGFEFDSFRWFRENAKATLPMIPGRDYELQIDGYAAKDHPVDVYVGGRNVGTIDGSGEVKWKRELTGAQRPRNRDVEIHLRGQEWSAGQVLGATRSFPVTMAVSRIALLPVNGQIQNRTVRGQAPNTPQFERELLRTSFLRETGRGITLVMPQEHVNNWMFMELLSTVMAHPDLLDPRFKFSTAADGETNRVFVSKQGAMNMYLNLDDRRKVVGPKQNLPEQIIPPKAIYFSF